MAAQRSGAGSVLATLSALAEACSDVEVGVACAGTALESRAFKVKKKAFLFVRPEDARLKLGASAAEATDLAVKDPRHYSFGGGGWATIRFGDGHVPARTRLTRWVKESYQLMAAPSSPARRTKAKAN